MWMEKENYQMHGQASQDSFYHATRRTHMVWRDSQGNKQPLVLMMYCQICGNLCPMRRKRKQNKDGLSRNQSSTMPDNWEEYSSLSQTTKNSSSRWKPLVESWKFRCQQQCLAKYRQRAVDKPPQYWETQDKRCLCCWCRRKHETKARRSWTQTSSRSHHCKRDEFHNSWQSCAQVHSDAPGVKISRCKGGSGEIMGKTDESQKQKRGDRWSKEWAQKTSFCVIDGSLSSLEFGVGTSILEIQKQSRTS